MIGSDLNTDLTRRKSFVDLEPVVLFLPDGCSNVISGRTVAVDFFDFGLPRGDIVVGVIILGVNGGVAITKKR
jgi:hypothetical protein